MAPAGLIIPHFPSDLFSCDCRCFGTMSKLSTCFALPALCAPSDTCRDTVSHLVHRKKTQEPHNCPFPKRSVPQNMSSKPTAYLHAKQSKECESGEIMCHITCYKVQTAPLSSLRAPVARADLGMMFESETYFEEVYLHIIHVAAHFQCLTAHLWSCKI